MTESYTTAETYCCAIGVIKFSQEKAGYPDVKKVANAWVNDKNFKQVILRKVSKDDYGIQFIFYVEDFEEKNGFGSWFREKYLEPNRENIYAWDIYFSSDSTKEAALKDVLKDEKI